MESTAQKFHTNNIGAKDREVAYPTPGVLQEIIMRTCGPEACSAAIDCW